MKEARFSKLNNKSILKRCLAPKVDDAAIQFCPEINLLIHFLVLFTIFMSKQTFKQMGIQKTYFIGIQFFLFDTILVKVKKW